MVFVSRISQTDPGTSSGRKLALIVGNGAARVGRASLGNEREYGKALARTLQEICGFTLFSPPLLGNAATTSQVREAVLDLADQLQEDDIGLFYFCGYAEDLLLEAGLDEIYLVTHDFQAQRLKRDRNAYLSLRWLRQMLFEHEKARSIFLLLDCYYLGYFSKQPPDLRLNELRSRLRSYFAEPGSQSPSRSGGVRQALTALGTDAVQGIDGCGLLTSYLLASLREERNLFTHKQGHITFGDFFDYLTLVMPPERRPHIFGSNVGTPFTASIYR